ncbi:MAG: hypothetical protein JWQ52_1900 [Phenylobacterium sp.]|jgi:hypothetical protein|nr:hypothetical protein [Phenylobacterium sp.]
MRHLRPAILAALAAFSLSGCERQKAAQPSVPPPAKLAADVSQAGLLAAAEPFEVLTEAAFTARLPVLDQAIATAVATAEHVRQALPPEARKELQTHLDAIAAARPTEDRAGVALASIEIYRMLVSYAPPGPVPKEVNLLDYVGFRYDADRKAQPTRWDDMVEAAAFGQRTWTAIEGRVADRALHDRESQALRDMAEAARLQNAALAADAAKRELDLVDLLEAYFSTTHR